MSTPELLMLLRLLPQVLRSNPEYFTQDERATAERMLLELNGYHALQGKPDATHS